MKCDVPLKLQTAHYNREQEVNIWPCLMGDKQLFANVMNWMTANCAQNDSHDGGCNLSALRQTCSQI